jgi:PAS domain S-box-containing protein
VSARDGRRPVARRRRPLAPCPRDADERLVFESDSHRAEALVSCSPDPIICFTPEGVITEWNPAAERMYGYSCDEAIGAPADLIVPPEFASSALFERLAAGKTVGAFDTERITKAGERVDVSISMSAIRDERGTVVGAAAFTRDIGPRVLAEERRRRMEALMAEAQEGATQRLDRANRRNEALLNSAGEGIYGIDRDGTTIFANPVAARLTGHRVGDIVGRSRHDAFRHTRPDGSPYPPSECPVSASLQDGTVHRCDADVYWRKDGTSFPVEYTSTPILENAAVVGAVVVFKDISERRELERSRDTFVASVSHELRTPLTSILGYLELIADTAEDLTEEHRRFLRVVDRNADRLLRVVDDLLLVAQVDAGAIELDLARVDIGGLVADAVEVAQPQAKAAGLELAAVVVATTVLHADRARLGQVLDNLISNAVKFTPSGGRVVLRALALDDRVVIEVSDDGAGMSPREQEQLFQRFYRTSAASEHAIPGTGLGLTIVKALVEAHGGTVVVKSAAGEGTTIRIELPAGGEPAARAAAVGAGTPAQPGRR